MVKVDLKLDPESDTGGDSDSKLPGFKDVWLLRCSKSKGCCCEEVGWVAVLESDQAQGYFGCHRSKQQQMC